MAAISEPPITTTPATPLAPAVSPKIDAGPPPTLQPLDLRAESELIRGHFRSHSTPNSPTHPKSTRILGALNEEGSDADVEETADEATADDATPKTKKKRRRMRRPKAQPHPASVTPKVGFNGDPDSPVVPKRLRILQRRATMPDAVEPRGVMSEGEGRDLAAASQSSWRRAPNWMSRGTEGDEPESPSGPGRRLGHIRRKSVFGGGQVSDGGDGMTPRRPFFGADRASTYGAAKWRQVKGAIKLLRQRRTDQFDYYKSAELMAELRAGAPAVLMLASMIQRDEHGNKRIPVLLEQLRVRISDSTPLEGDSERHWLFTIDLEYGSGPSRMCWTVKRTIREILNLHWKYKLAIGNEKYSINIGTGRPRQPRFPTSVFPYVRGLRGVDEGEDEDDQGSNQGDGDGDETAGEGAAGEGTAADGNATDLDERNRLNRTRSRLSTLQDVNSTHESQMQEALQHRGKYIDKQRRMLEKYLQEMVRWLMFRADSNRLCRFLELSALGVRLAAEGSYHGKECFLHIQSAKGLDFRRVLTPKAVIERHSRKWFLVRQSYIVCVESPENMNIYDVYLVDPKFRIISKKSKLMQMAATAANRTKQVADKGKGKLTPGPSRTNTFASVAGQDEAAVAAAAAASSTAAAKDFDESTQQSHHRVTLLTSERKVKLWSTNQHLIQQFEESITGMLAQTPWHRENRFGSFAPVRPGVFAQWLVDGRDYMWNVSRAINMAKDVIYIHDWWLSPEIYMRRPPCISQKWRLDRLLQRKAEEGVKIFVIIYRNVQQAIPIDSEYTKHSLLNLHPNIFVQRSPHQFKKNQFFFAHHEKICIVDHIVAFVGGIDLCFGRWDTPQHPVADDKRTGFEPGDYPKDTDHTQVFPGKDYSNARVADFSNLNQPYEEMYERTQTPRMPWHDVAMQVVGQPARDLTRHFVQRWNYIRRGRKPTRPTPFLLPPPDCRPEELEELGLTGTCEVQILRSAATWSLGITDTEASIHAAYLKLIAQSEHFVYIENQFFITGGETLNVQFSNGIADALVERAIRAHRNDEEWRAVILIPLLPGFEGGVAEQDGSSVRLIMQCQLRSICRGETSIFSRLRDAGVEPEDYIQFFSLRQWGRIGPNATLVTEQLYIHAKLIIVDDRVALIGSANINERSMLGSRDSEVAAVVRDRDVIWSTMAGRPYQVGRFAHSLRLRLMREHLGLDVDEILEQERQADLAHQQDEAQFNSDMEQIYGDGSREGSSRQHGRGAGDSDDSDVGEAHEKPPVVAESSSAASPETQQQQQKPERPSIRTRRPSSSVNNEVDWDVLNDSQNLDRSQSNRDRNSSHHRDTQQETDHRREVEGYGQDHWKSAENQGLDQGRDSVVVGGREVLMHHIFPEGKVTMDSPISATSSKNMVFPPYEDAISSEVPPPPPTLQRKTTEQLGLPRANQLPSLPLLDDTDIGGPPVHTDANGRVHEGHSNPWAFDIRKADVHKDCMKDPLAPSFYDDVWAHVAENNTKIYRRVFHCMPDSEVTNWYEYKDYLELQEKFRTSQETSRPDTETTEKGTTSSSVHTPRNNNQGPDQEVVNEKQQPQQELNEKQESHQELNKKRSHQDLSEKQLPPLPPTQEEEHEEKQEQQPEEGALSEKHATGAGAGISAPPPEMFASPRLSLSEKASYFFGLPSGGSKKDDPLQNKPLPSARNSEEKQRGGGFVGTPSHSRQSSRLDRELAAAAERALNTPKIDQSASAFTVASNKEKGKSKSVLFGAQSPLQQQQRRPTFVISEEKERPPRTAGANSTTSTSTTNPNSNNTLQVNGAGGGGNNNHLNPNSINGGGSVHRRRRATTKGSRRGFQLDQVLKKPDAEELLGMLQGTIVQFPYDWLSVEENNGNWLYQADLVAPLQIYN